MKIAVTYARLRNVIRLKRFMRVVIFFPALSLRFGILTWALLFLVRSVHADDGTWLSNPENNDWNNGSNWSSGTVPGFEDIATFDSSNVTRLTISGLTNNAGIVFNAGADSFTITPSVANEANIVCDGNVENNSGIAQNFVLGPGTFFELFNFPNEPAWVVGSLITFTNQAGGGTVLFEGTSSGGAGTFINQGGSVAGQTGGITQFIGTATAGGSTPINQGATASGAKGGAPSLCNSFRRRATRP